jgi:hypothetical protein
MKIKLSQCLPDGDANGLGGVARDLIEDPTAQHVVVGIVDCLRYTTDVDSGVKIPTVRFLRVEAVTDPDTSAVMQSLLKRLHEERCGTPPIPGIDRASGAHLDRDNGPGLTVADHLVEVARST